jgi:hypothetical protein
MSYFNKDGDPIDLREWARLLDDADYERVALTTLGDSEVSTVWLGLDHSFGPGPILIFETMVFGGPLSSEEERYTTLAQAQAGHEAMVERVRVAAAEQTAKPAPPPAVAAMADDYDWREAFKYAANPSRCEGAACEVGGFEIGDVAEVLALVEGENDGASWETLVKLTDGRFGYLTAGCDYTGWGCQESGSSWVSDDLGNLWRFGVTEEARNRFLADERTAPIVRVTGGAAHV